MALSYKNCTSCIKIVRKKRHREIEDQVKI